MKLSEYRFHCGLDLERNPLVEGEACRAQGLGQAGNIYIKPVSSGREGFRGADQATLAAAEIFSQAVLDKSGCARSR